MTAFRKQPLMFYAPVKPVNGSWSVDYRRYESPSYLRLGLHARFMVPKVVQQETSQVLLRQAS